MKKVAYLEASYEDLYRALFEESPNPTVLLDEESRFLDANPAALKLLELEPAELRTKSILDFLSDQFDPDEFLTRKSDLWEQGGLLEFEFRVNGQVKALEMALTPVRLGDRRVVYGVGKDITARKEVGEQLARQLREIQTLYEISRLLAETVDLKTVLQQIADSAAALIQQDCRTVLHLLDEDGVSLSPVAVGGSSTPETMISLNFRRGEGLAGIALETGQTISVPDAPNDPRFKTSRRSATKVRSMIVAPVKFGEKSLGTLSVYSPRKNVFQRDEERLLTMLGANAAVAIEKTTLYANLQATLKQEQATRTQLVQSEKLAALGRIVASVAHELNNPLQAIQNALYLIRLEEDLSAQAIEDLQVALNEANRMAALIDRLRETYRPASGEDFQFESVNELVLEAYKLISTHLRHQQIEFIFDGDPNVPPSHLIPDQIKQVILNICLNAVEMIAENPQAGNKYYVRVQTKYDPERREIELAISDNGPGIPGDVLPNIFDPFVTTKEKGTGLGLAITYDIVRRHEGRIEAQSEPGVLTTFRILLPIRQ